MPFVNLHAHSDASIADGLFGPKKWVAALKAKGFKAHALTDHGNMANVLPFYKLMRQEGMTALLGMEAYYVDDPELKTPENRKNSHLVLIAKNYDGFRNLLKLSELSFGRGYYYKPRIGLEWLTQYSEGLVCLSACQGGVLANEVWREVQGQPHMGLTKRFEQFRSIFGDDFYVEFQAHNTPNLDKETGKTFNSQALINQGLYRLRKEPGFKPIATNDCHYILEEHAPIQKIIKAVSWGKNDSAESSTVTDDHFCNSLWLKKPQQILETFQEHHDLPDRFTKTALINTGEVFEKCVDFRLPEDQRYLPRFRKEVDSKALFKALTIKRLKKFLAKPELLRAPKADYVERFKKEFKVISKYNLEDYFLIVWDLIRFADRRDIYSGLGRGSAAGCLISYLLGIVKIDPLEHGLLFERFLNQNRCETGELPDIDLDFESERRAEIKEYIYETYGKAQVCEIGTYGRMKLKTSLIDFAKATGAATHREILDITTKLDLDKESVDDLLAAMEFDPKLDRIMKANPQLQFMVSEITGQIKTQAVHPAGLIICSQPVAEITPVKTQTNNKVKGGERVVATQSEDKHVIAQGLMKVDVLGLKEYDVIHYVVENAPDFPYSRENYVEEIMNAERAEPNEEVWRLFRQGNTEAVFQFASDGMKGLLREMKPDKVQDLIAANALYRPGCLENGWHLDYCNRKSGVDAVEYVHKDVEAALGETYGVIVYQEQFMEVIHRLGGVNLVDADTIRSALGKKDKAKLGKFKSQFVDGAAGRIGRTEAEKLWEQIEKASGYTFNKSHSAAYSVLAYVSQWLKYHYPAHFWAAQLHWDIHKNKLEDMLTDRRAADDMGVKYVLPNVNTAKTEFWVNKDDEIVWSIKSIGSVGPTAAEEIVAKAPYDSFEDFYERVNKAKVKFNVIEKMIYAGAFDTLDDRRECLRQLFEFSNAKKAKAQKKPYIKPTEEQIMMRFRDALGFFERNVKDLKGTFSSDVLSEAELRAVRDGQHVTVGGVITEVRVAQTKSREPMAFVTLMDLDEIIQVTVFPTTFGRYRSLLKENTCVEITGKKNCYKDQQNVVLADSFEEK